ncbi:MAG: hypothetical protein ACE1Z6_09910 [Candidatus Methylomirabilales bacterium]|nr:hypothetical protein [candidate division NC10 bacterium]
MDLIQAEEARLQKLEGQAAEVGRLDLKDQEEAEGLQKELDQKLRDGESIAACQKIQAHLESIEQRRRGRATIREGFEEQAKVTRTRIAELEKERFIGVVPQRVAAINKVAAALTHDLMARLEQFARDVKETVLDPAQVLQGESRKHAVRDIREHRMAFRLRAFVVEWGGQGRKILEDIHREAQR